MGKCGVQLLTYLNFAFKTTNKPCLNYTPIWATLVNTQTHTQTDRF